jgi:thioredoxin reductase
LKDKLGWYHTYLEGRLAVSQVKVTLGTRAHADMIAALKPDVIFVASGRGGSTLQIEGGTAGMTHDAYEMLMGDDTWLTRVPPGPMLVYGGGETGCEAAEYLTERGRDVVLVSRSSLKDLARTAEFIYRTVLLRRLKANTHLRMMGDTTLLRMEDGVAVVRGADGVEQRLPVAGVLVAQGRIADDTLASELERRGLPVHVIGDARRGGRIGDAVHDAYQTISKLTAPPRGQPVLGQVAC